MVFVNSDTEEAERKLEIEEAGLLHRLVPLHAMYEMIVAFPSGCMSNIGFPSDYEVAPAELEISSLLAASFTWVGADLR